MLSPEDIVNLTTVADGMGSVPKCLDYRSAHLTAVCVSMHCQRCQYLRSEVGDPPLTIDTVPYSDAPNIVRGTD